MLKKYDCFLHLDSVLSHRAFRGNRMKQEGRQNSWPQKWLWPFCTYVQSHNLWNSFCIHTCYCTAHKLHTVICLTHMTALENQHYFLFMDQETEALRDEATSPGQSYVATAGFESSSPDAQCSFHFLGGAGTLSSYPCVCHIMVYHKEHTG